MKKYNWHLDSEVEEVEEEAEVEVASNDDSDYKAVKGINHKGLNLRVEPGEIVPAALLKTKAFKMWLKDGAIKKVGD